MCVCIQRDFRISAEESFVLSEANEPTRTILHVEGGWSKGMKVFLGTTKSVFHQGIVKGHLGTKVAKMNM